MPLYDYQCPKCKGVFDAQRPIADRNAPLKCPWCNGAPTLLVGMTAPAVVAAGPSKDVRKRVIVSERQVTSQYGGRWRDEGTTGKPGGIGRKKIFT